MQPVMERRPDMPTHRQHHDRQGQQARKQRVAAQSGDVSGVTFRSGVRPVVRQGAGGITCPFDSSDQIRFVHRAHKNTQPRLPVCKVESGRYDTRNRRQSRFDPRHA